MSKSLKATKKSTTGNRSKRNFIDDSILAYDFLNACSKVLYSRPGRRPSRPQRRDKSWPNPTSRRNPPMRSSSHPATTGGAAVGARKASRSATGPTRPPNSHRLNSPSPKPRNSGCAAASAPAISRSATAPTRPCSAAAGRSFRLFLRRRPAALLAVVATERTFHGSASHAPRKFAAHAFAVHVGEADPEAAQARFAQAREHRAEIRHAFDSLELLVEIEAELVRAASGELQRPAPRYVGRNGPHTD